MASRRLLQSHCQEFEGTLTMHQWNNAQGEGLKVAAWKVERVGSIGKNHERRPGTYQENGMVPPKQDSRANTLIAKMKFRFRTAGGKLAK
jgi:hypothetical protein